MSKNIKLSNDFAIGSNCPTALNVLIGANDNNITKELEKIEQILNKELPVSIITDLSLAKPVNNNELWREVSRNTPFLSGTVPVYQAVTDNGDIDANKLLDLIEDQVESGVNLITIHPTPTRELLSLCKNRLIPITSRGGGAVAKDMILNQREENIYVELLDDIIKKHLILVQ